MLKRAEFVRNFVIWKRVSALNVQLHLAAPPLFPPPTHHCFHCASFKVCVWTLGAAPVSGDVLWSLNASLDGDIRLSCRRPSPRPAVNEKRDTFSSGSE